MKVSNCLFMSETTKELNALGDEFYSEGFLTFFQASFKTIENSKLAHETTWQELRIKAIEPKINALVKRYEKQYRDFLLQMTQDMTLMEEVVLLGKATKLFNERINDNALSSPIQNTLEMLSYTILNQYPIPLYDHKQIILLSIPYSTYIKFAPPNEKGGLVELTAIFQRSKGKDLYPVIPVTEQDYNAGLEWVDGGQIHVGNFNSLIRFASIFKIRVLADQIDKFAADYSAILIAKTRVDLSELNRQVQFAFQYDLLDLQEVCRRQFVSNLQYPETESQLHRLITFNQKQEIDVLFGKMGIIPSVIIKSMDGKATSEMHFGKLFCLSGLFQNLIKDVPWNGYTPFPFIAPFILSQDLLSLCITILEEGKGGQRITKANCVNLFVLADFWDIPFLYEESLDHVLDKYMYFSKDEEVQFQAFLYQILHLLPLQVKPGFIENITKKFKYYANRYVQYPWHAETEVLEGWIDIAVKHNLEEMKKWLIEFFEDLFLFFLEHNIMPKNLKDLPQMKVKFSHGRPLFNIKELEGLDLISLDLTNVETLYGDINQIVQMFPKLTKLTLPTLNLKDSDLLILVDLPVLQELTLSCPNISKKGCIEFLKALTSKREKSQYFRLTLNRTLVKIPVSWSG